MVILKKLLSFRHELDKAPKFALDHDCDVLDFALESNLQYASYVVGSVYRV